MIRIISFSFLGLLLCASISLPMENEETASSLDAANVGPAQLNLEDIGPGRCSPRSGGWILDDVVWTQVSDAPLPIGRSGAGVLGNYMYCFGGEAGNFGQAFNLTTEQWEASTPPPLPRDNWCGVATDDAIYLIGRYNPGVGYGAEIQKFTPTGGGPSGTWTTIANYPIAACGIGAAWDGGDFIYAAGGNPSAAATLAHKYSISQNMWTPIANLPIGMGYCGGAFVYGKFYVLGGIMPPAANSLYEYDPDSNTWTQKANLLATVWFATFGTTFNLDHIIVVTSEFSPPFSNAVQIYDPTTDTWILETPPPVARNQNSSRYAGGGRVISAGGYVSPGLWTTITYRGDGFPGGAAVPTVSVTMTPVSPPINIPPQGGSFDWNITLHNNESTPQTFDVWTIITLPNGSTRPGWGPFLNLTMGVGATINRVRTQFISERYPSGEYTYIGNVGDHPDSVWDSDSFPFTKLLGGDGGWAVKRAHDGQGSTLTPGEYLLHGATPNPFNPTTTLSFALPQAGQVKLSVCSVSGQEVATLVNGWRNAGIHEVTFDGSALASGLYVYKLTAGDFHAAGKMAFMK